MRSKNSLIRERVIDSCQSDKTRWWSLFEMMEAVNKALDEQGEARGRRRCAQWTSTPTASSSGIRDALERKCTQSDNEI